MYALLRYWNTIRHLRPVQVYGRAMFRLAKPRADLRPAPSVRTTSRGGWQMPAAHRAGFVAPDSFSFLNQTFALSEHGWDDPSLEKLWRYNLHYFDDLTAPGSGETVAARAELLRRWIRENPPAVGSGWEPYPTSLRIVNWIKWALAGNELPPENVESIAIQTRWLTRRLETHLLGNHLFANAKALVFAGLFFEGEEAERWFELGLQILSREVPEQILPDGGQFERSPMYHALALEDLLDLANIVSAFNEGLPTTSRSTIATWPSHIERMLDWLVAMSHPDGEISFFNDAAIGVAPTPTALIDYAARLGMGTAASPTHGVTDLPASGYLRAEIRDAVAILDLAPVGPDYLPAHAHADTLSFELSLFGQRVLVNSGTSCYGGSAERHRQRGTSAHNTVIVDGKDSTEVWGGFRVARRARPVLRSITHVNEIAIACAHDGYDRLPNRPRHFRQWTFREGAMTVEDRVSGMFGQAEARFHLHPAVRIEGISRTNEGSSVTLHMPHGQIARFRVESGRLRIQATTWHPGFGRTIPNQCLVVELENALARIRLDWDQAA